MKNIENNILEILCRETFLSFKEEGYIIKDKIVKEMDRVSLIDIYESNKKIIKNYKPHPN